MELSETPLGGLRANVLVERMRAYAEDTRVPNTWRVYQSDLHHFAAWCAEHGITDPVPAAPTAVAAYLTEFAGGGWVHASTETTQLYTLLADEVADAEIRAARRRRGTWAVR